LTTDIASMSVNIGADLGNTAPMLGEFGAVLGNIAPMLGESGAVLGKSGADSGKSGAVFRITGAVLGNKAPVRVIQSQAPERLGALSTYQLVLQRVTGKVGVGAHFHFFQNPRPVGADRFDAQQQFIGNFGNRFAEGKHPQHLVLPI
jgi:hypothetical protein